MRSQVQCFDAKLLMLPTGGSLESVRAKRLSGELGIPIAENQIVQSHTIFKALAGTYANSPVLIVGGQKDSCRQVAEAYGFKHAYIPADVLAWNPAVWPFDKLTDEERGYIKVVTVSQLWNCSLSTDFALQKADFSNIRFAAVLVFHDSRDWGRDIQLSIDLMRAEKGVFGTCKDPSNAALWTAEKQLPLYFSNPDLLWGNDFSQPRFGQGALQESMAAVYKATTGHELKRCACFVLDLAGSTLGPRCSVDPLEENPPESLTSILLSCCTTTSRP